MLNRLQEGDRWQVLGGLLPAFALSIIFWKTPAIDPLTAPALLLDRTLQVATLGFAPATAAVMLAPAVPALYAALYASVVGVALGSSVALTGLVRPQADWAMVALAAVAAATSAWVLWKFGLRLTWLQSAGAKLLAVLLAAAVPLLQFWNGAAFLPGRTEANLTQTVTVEFRDDSRGVLQYTAANDTDARVLVIISQLIVCRWEADEPVTYDIPTIRDAPNCEQYRPVRERSWIAAESELDWQAAVDVPADTPKFTVLARIAYARGDRLRTDDEEEPLGDVGRCADVVAVRLLEESRVKGVAQPEKYLVYADLDRDRGRNYFYDFGPSVDCPGEGADQLNDYFGTTEATLIFESWAGANDAADN